MSKETIYPIDFKRLPGDLQGRLLQLQAPADDRFVFFHRVSLVYLAPVVAAAAWLIYVYTATQQLLWEDWMFYLICGTSIVVLPTAFYGLWRLVVPALTKLKSGYVVTKDEFLKTRDRRIEIWSLKDLDALRFKEDDREFEIWIGDREETINNVEAADGFRLDGLFDGWKQNAGAGLGDELRDPAFRFTGSYRVATLAAGLIISVLIGFLSARAFAAVNRNFDDAQTWTLAEQAGSIEQLENYKTRHPAGSFVAEADRKIGEQVARVKDDYLNSVAGGADRAAVDAFATILERAASRPDRTIFVRVTEKREIDDSIVDEIAARLRVTMNGYDVTVPASGEAFRRNKVFADLRLLLAGSKNRGAVRFELVDNPPADAPAIDVNLLIKSERLIFRVNSFSDGRLQVSNYPGSSFIFSVDLRDGLSTLYHMEYAGQPLSVNSGAYDRRDRENYSFDKVYFSAATDGFDELVGQTFGLKARSESEY